MHFNVGKSHYILLTNKKMIIKNYILIISKKYNEFKILRKGKVTWRFGVSVIVFRRYGTDDAIHDSGGPQSTSKQRRAFVYTI